MKHNHNLIAHIFSYFSLFVGVLLCILQLLELLGITQWVTFRNQLPSLTLLVSAMILTHLALERNTVLRSLQTSIDLHQVENLSLLQEHLDPRLEQIFGGEIKNALRLVQDALKHQRVSFTAVDQFVRYYKKTLEAHPKTHFLATSLPYSSYFWNEARVKLFKDFIEKGGKFTRVFFVTEQEMQDPEVRDILDKQRGVGIEVHVCNLNMISPRLVRYYVIDRDARIGWSIVINSKKEITQVTATTNRQDTSQFANDFEELLRSEATELYSGT